MEFRKWWDSLPNHIPKHAIDIARMGYCAGLLHAAEQDEGIAKQNKDLPMTCPRAYEYSAIFHREAANDLK